MSTLEEYLRQLYQKNAQNASPALQSGMMADAAKQAALDAAYRPRLPNNRRLHPTGTSSHMPPGGYPKPPDLHDSFHTNARGGGLSMRDASNNQLQTYLDFLKDRHQTAVDDGSLAQAQSQIQTANTPDPLTDIESRIAALAGKPDIPGHWESPYSQDYLNQLGDRLGQAGGAAQQAFGEAKNQIAADYQGGIDQRNKIQGGLTAALQGNGQNIGVDYAKSLGGQQAGQDMAYLSQIAETNKASDLATNDKLGVIANQTGSNLGMQAREGLLTPKEWINAQSGLSGGDSLMADFLMNKYNQTVDSQQADRAATASGASLADFAKTLTGTADENIKQNYPDVVQGLSGITDQKTLDEANRIWNITGDPAEAVKYLETTWKTSEHPNLSKMLTKPTRGRPGGSTSQSANQYALDQYHKSMADYTANSGGQAEQQAMFQYLLNFFNQYNPNRTPVITGRTTSNSSSDKFTQKS